MNNLKEAWDKALNATSKQIQNANRRAFRRVLSGVRKTAQQNITSRLKGKVSFKKDIRLTKFVKDKDNNYSQGITIRSNRKKGGKSYLLQIFEGGSYKVGVRYSKRYKGKKFKERKRGTKRPKTHYRGKTIKPIVKPTGRRGKLQGLFFFRDALNQHERTVQQTLEQELIKSFSEIKI